MTDAFVMTDPFGTGPMYPQKCAFCDRQSWASQPWTEPYICSPCAVQRLMPPVETEIPEPYKSQTDQ